MAVADANTPIKTAKEIGTDPAGVVRRWLAELDLSTTNEEKWRKLAGEAWDLYRSKDIRADSFNILWSNTETMRPALYNSQPEPDIRRRFRDADPVGKVASNVLERSLTYSIDAYDFDQEIKLTILDMLLSGRGVTRIKYNAEVGDESVTDEDAECEHVQWKDFRVGPGKTWTEVRWIGFRHDLTFDDCVGMFGRDKAEKLEFTERGKFADDSQHNDDVKALLKTAEVWEIWDKDERKTYFLSMSYKSGPLKTVEDALKLKDFFPVPRPLYAIEDTESLIPQILYEKYRNQAEELNEITFRLRRIIRALKVRGAYTAHLSEIGKILDANDTEMIAIENGSLVNEIGGLDKAIWIMPIDKLIQVAEGLFEARGKCIETIYEITGLGDIMRGVSNPHETLGAQQLKSQWGSLRLQRLQREVQRFIRDLFRLKAEVMSEFFDVKTFMSMTGILLPTKQQKESAAQLLQVAQQSAQAPSQDGQPPAPQIPQEKLDAAENALKLPTWDDVMTLLKSDYMRQYRIDIETDSTIQETLTKDTQGLTEAITGIVNLFTGIGPAIQQGFLSVEVVKQLALSAARLSRMGQPVEDALEQIKQPPPASPEQQPQDFSLQVAQIKAQSDQQLAQAKSQSDMQLEQFRTQSQQAVTQMTTQSQQQIADAGNKAKLEVAGITAQTQLQIAGLNAQTQQTLADKEAGLKMGLAQQDASTKMGLAQQDSQSKKELAQQGTESDLAMAEHGAQTQEKLADKKAANDFSLAQHGAQTDEKLADKNAENKLAVAETSAKAKAATNKPKK